MKGYTDFLEGEDLVEEYKLTKKLSNLPTRLFKCLGWVIYYLKIAHGEDSASDRVHYALRGQEVSLRNAAVAVQPEEDASRVDQLLEEQLAGFGGGSWVRLSSTATRHGQGRVAECCLYVYMERAGDGIRGHADNHRTGGRVGILYGPQR